MKYIVVAIGLLMISQEVQIFYLEEKVNFYTKEQVEMTEGLATAIKTNTRTIELHTQAISNLAEATRNNSKSIRILSGDK